jgi:hypothetical protein
VALQGYSDIPGGVSTLSITNKTIVTSNVIPLTTSNTTGSTGITMQATNFSNIVSTTRTQYNDGTPQNFTGTGASAATYISAVTMGTGGYIYTTASVTGVYFIVAIDVTTVPPSTSNIIISSSSSIFTPASPSTWLAGATTKTYQLQSLTSNATSYTYRTDQVYTNKTNTILVSRNIYTARTYYIPYDVVAPIFTSTYKGVGIATEDTVTVTIGTAPTTFIQYNNNSNPGGLAIWTDDSYVNTNYSTRIQESNNIVYSTKGNYTISFVATDTNLNSRTLNLYVAVV